MPFYIDGRVPVDVTTLDASVEVITPYIRQSSGANVIAIDNPAGDDTLVTLTDVQTLSSKTLLNPVITTGTLSSPVVYSGTFSGMAITSAYIQTCTINSPSINMSGGQLSGGIYFDSVNYGGSIQVLTSLTPKTLDMTTANVFICNITGVATLTIENAQDGKQYVLILQQSLANSYSDIALPNNFINQAIASGPTQSTGAVDIYNVTYYNGYNYVTSGKDLR